MSETARFNKAGHYYNEMNGEYQEGYPMKGSVIGTDGVKIFAVQMQDGVYSVVGSSEQYSLYGEWVNFTLTDNEPEDVLKDWSFTVSVDANEGASRKAELMIIPGTVEINDPDYDLFNDTATAIKDELAGYVYSLISQEGSAGDERTKVKDWYDGFIFGRKRDIYNPWSVLNYLDKPRLSAYWVNTSSNPRQVHA